MLELLLQPLALTAAAELSGRAIFWLATFGVILLCGSIMLCLVRMVLGPTLADRATALDVIGIQVVGLVILFTIRSGSLLFVDGILVLTLLSFAGVVAAAQFVARPFIRPVSPPQRSGVAAGSSGDGISSR